jgi:hypothetical protein
MARERMLIVVWAASEVEIPCGVSSSLTLAS